MLGKAMRFATVCTLAFAICGKASRDKVAAVSKGTTEDLEHRFRQETNFEDHVSTTSLCSRVRRLAVILTLSSAVTSADAFAPLYANRQGKEAQAQVALKPLETRTQAQITPADVEGFLAGVTPLGLAELEHPTPADVEVFRGLNKLKLCRPMFEILDSPGCAKTPLEKWSNLGIKEKAGLWRMAYAYKDPDTARGLGKFAYGLNLSPDEEAALWSFTYEDADIINQIARGADTVEFTVYSSYSRRTAADIRCTLTKEDMLPWLKILNAGLNKMPSAAAGRLYRGVGFNAEDTPGSIAPITGFSSFSEDFNVAKCFVEEKRKKGIQPTIFVMDKHSSGRKLEHIGDIPDHKEVVFRVGTKFRIEEDEKVQREVEALWRENLAAGTSYDGWKTIQGTPPRRWPFPFNKEAVPDFKVLVVKEVPTDEA